MLLKSPDRQFQKMEASFPVPRPRVPFLLRYQPAETLTPFCGGPSNWNWSLATMEPVEPRSSMRAEPVREILGDVPLQL